MRICGVWATVAILAPALCGGCGTLLNDLSCGADHDREPYGGMKISLEAGSSCMKNAANPSENEPLWGPMLAGTYMLGVDLPLSVALDTVSLPWTIYSVVSGEATTNPVHWGQPPFGPHIQPGPLAPDQGPVANAVMPAPSEPTPRPAN